jgi:hypothetical protein
MRTLLVRALVLVVSLGCAGCGGTDHRLLGNTQTTGAVKVCPYGAAVC